MQGTEVVPWSWNGWSAKTAPVFGDALAYVIAPPKLHAIDPVTNAVAWKANGGYQGTAAGGGWLAIASGRLLVARANGTLSAYRLTE